MHVIVTGGRGQLGRQIESVFNNHTVTVVDLPEYDVRDSATTTSLVQLRPDLLIHAAAMTDVDGCARDPDAAMRSNALGTRYVALAAQRSGAVLLYVSTNEVFSGTASAPYDEFAPVHPVNPYGRSKAAGEMIVRELVPNHYIARTAWLFGPGGVNFVTKILARAESGTLRVVDDEIGSPTYAPDLAQAIVKLVATGCYGTYHLVNEGVASRFDIAAAIVNSLGLRVNLNRASLAEFDRPSSVPPYSPLRNFAAADLGIQLRPWSEALAEYLSWLVP